MIIDPSLLPDDLEQLLDRYDQSWLSNPPILSEFLNSHLTGRDLQPAVRRHFLIELIKIDLDYRWKQGSKPRADAGAATPTALPPQPLLDDYLCCLPELGPPEQLPPDLISAEYSARLAWGDRASHQDYRLRFPAQAAALGPLLRELDAERASDVCKAVPLIPVAQQALSTTDFLAVVRETGLMNAEQLDPLLRDHAQVDVQILARHLIDNDRLTPYQATQILQGKGRDLVLGPYIVLEFLGEGMRGQVYKVRHQRMRRVTALKVIRKELLADPEVVRRFYTEIQAISQMSHPNVVHAYDAGPVGQTHFLAMEYVEGIDLGRLIKTRGPLAVDVACEYLRQAALGLQHAHEYGMVHRDIKPVNLLVGRAARSGEDIIKILDLGLARVIRLPGEMASPAVSSGTCTPEGTMMGTPDYMSPEQAFAPQDADIRSDLYSLGCTFYYLLAAKVPFPGGTIFQKVDMHRSQPPQAIDRLRPGLPANVVHIVGKLMAKRPEDRFQTPAELLAALPAPLACVAPSHPGERPPAVAVPLSSQRRADQVRRRLCKLFAAIRKYPRTVGVTVLLLTGLLLLPFVKPGSPPPSHPPAKPPIVLGPLVSTVIVEANHPWQDTYIDVQPDELLTIRAAGTWKSSADSSEVTANGNPNAPRTGNLLPDLPAMCLLGQIGAGETPFLLGGEFKRRFRKGGRLFVRANGLLLAQHSGKIELHIQGGQPGALLVPVWEYGSGAVDEASKSVKTFEPLACWMGRRWQGGPMLPDPKTGWVFMQASGAGHPGDPQHTAIRRWQVPRDCVFTLTGTLHHNLEDSDGVQARLIVSGQGELGAWVAERSTAETTVSQVAVKKGDVVDLVVDCRGSVTNDSYTWGATIIIEQQGNEAPPAKVP